MSDNENPLLKVSLKVLEDWAMMLVDPADGKTELFELDAPLFRSHIEMHGAFHGRISIIAQESFMRGLATNLLGANDPSSISDADFTDAFREMGNVLAGNFLTEAYGADVAFDVLNPKVEQVSAEELKQLAQRPQTYFLKADEEPICVSFEIGEFK